MIKRLTLNAFLFLTLGFVPLPGISAEKSDIPVDATVLCYHVVESPGDTKFSLERETFREQMTYLAATGYNVVPLADLVDYVAGRKKTLPRNAVAITVDDGWRCTYDEIFPELKRFRFPFTVFIYPKFIGMSTLALSWKQVKEMSDDGVDIQSHSFSHPFLTYRRHTSLGPARYAEWLQNELASSKKLIERETGREVRFLAYPYGDYDTRVAETAKKAGYDGGLTCDFGFVRKGSDPLRMKRAVVYQNTSYSAFRHLLGPAPLKLAEASPASGTLFTQEEPVISARIADPELLDPATVGMTVLSLGATPYSYDPRNGEISLVVREPLKGSAQRVIIWGNEKKTGRRVEAAWTFNATPTPESTSTSGVTARTISRPSTSTRLRAPRPGSGPPTTMIEPSDVERNR